MTPNDAPPPSEEEIAEIRRVLDICRLKDPPLDVVPLENFDRLVAERDALRVKWGDAMRATKSLMDQRDALLSENASLKAEVERLKADGERTYIDVLFDGPPSHESGRFVEVENANRESINFGEWVEDGNYWRLRFPVRGTAIDLARKAQGGE